MKLLGILGLVALMATTVVANEIPTLTVTGTGSSGAVPDEAYINAGIVTRHQDAGTAVGQNTEQMKKLYVTLAEFGVEKKDIQTIQFRVERVQDHRTDTLKGYDVVNQVRVTVCDLDKLGKIVGAVVGDGANSINGLSFGSSQATKHQSDARTAAVKDAAAKAKTIADALGVELGLVQAVHETEGYRGAPMYGGERIMAASMDVPISGGTVNYQVEVSVVYQIEQNGGWNLRDEIRKGGE